MATPPRSAVLAAVGAGTAAALAAQLLGRRGAALWAGLATAALTADVVHFLRVALDDAVHALRREPRASVIEPHVTSYVCWPADVDRNAHINNARYGRVLNFARRAFWKRNGVWAHCIARSPRANMVVVGASIRYRREIPCFERYDVAKRLVHWDAAAFYVEHRFIRRADHFILAVGLIKCGAAAARRDLGATCLA